MGALTISDLTPMAGEPTVPDVRLGEVLGFQRPRAVRQLIERNAEEVARYGPLATRRGKSRGQSFNEFYLNEGQALVLCALAQTPRAADVRFQLIQVFVAWRRGELVEAADSPDATVVVLQRLERRLAALESAGGQLSSLAAEPENSARALTYADAIWAFEGRRQIRPSFWFDVPVRGLILAGHRQMTIDRCRALCVETYGEDRTPSRSSLGRFWKALDRLRGQYPSLKAH